MQGLGLGLGLGIGLAEKFSRNFMFHAIYAILENFPAISHYIMLQSTLLLLMIILKKIKYIN